MVWAIKQILPGGPGGETTEDGAGTSNAILRNSGILLLLCLALHQATNVVKETVREEFQSTLLRSLETGLGFSMFSFYVCIIDVFMNSVAGLADRLESIATSNPASSKMKGFMKNMARFRNPEKPILDKAYAIPGGTRSPARVLVEVAGVYGNLAKIAGFILLFLYMVGVDLYSTLVIVGVTALFASLLQALSINEAFSNLIPLALSNSVHIGEIVGIAGTGASPANKPDEALVGFVEAITWSHVVIRDFKRNQVFVPHHEMEKLTLYNWSRRPSKLIRFELAVVPSLSGGADRLATLSKFVLDWIAKHPKIDQQLYSKCALKIRSETAQPFLEIIFYPLVGEKARPIRAEFTVMIMDACKRLDICLVPAEVRMASAWPVEFSEVQDIATASARLQEEEDMGPDLSDLMPSEALTKRSGLPPSKKKKD
jgi:small-conductance mechanosensitive channel